MDVIGEKNRVGGGKYADIVESIGHTPLVELKRLSPKPGVRLWAKLHHYTSRRARHRRGASKEGG